MGGRRARLDRFSAGAHASPRSLGGLFQQHAQAAHGPQVAHAGGGLRKFERFGRLLISELLEMAHEDDFAIRFVERFERRLKALLQFVMCGGRGGGSFRDRAPAPPDPWPIGRPWRPWPAAVRDRRCAARRPDAGRWASIK